MGGNAKIFLAFDGVATQRILCGEIMRIVLAMMAMVGGRHTVYGNEVRESEVWQVNSCQNGVLCEQVHEIQDRFTMH